MNILESYKLTKYMFDEMVHGRSVSGFEIHDVCDENGYMRDEFMDNMLRRGFNLCHLLAFSTPIRAELGGYWDGSYLSFTEYVWFYIVYAVRNKGEMLNIHLCDLLL